MRYKSLYVELAELLTELGCNVCDQDMWGYCYQTKAMRAFIVIKPNMSYKSKFLTLAHEAGHLFYMKGGEFIWSEKPRTENKANLFALQYLDQNEIDSHEYHKFYDTAKEAVKTRKKSWFEI